MAKQAKWKQWTAAVAVTALVGTGITGIAPAAYAASNPFTDVKSGVWYEKHVTKLYLQGIVSGKGEGIFDPAGQIRREDAVIVALRFMGLADQIDTTGAIAFPSSFQADDYAKPYINEAFKRKILLTDEEFALAAAEKGKSWGQASASREWVARLLVRAIGKEADAQASAGKTTSFADDAKIDPALKPYVVTAVNEGLVAGVTPTTFEPKSPINRAAIATLFSKAEAKLQVAYSGQVKGMLLDIAADKLTMLHDDGSLHYYTLTPQTLYARYDSDLPSTLAGLKPYGKATVILDENGAVGYVEQTDDTAYVTKTEGTFQRLNAATGSIWLSVGEGFKEYFYDKSTLPVVTDTQGKTIALADIPADAVIELMQDAIRTTPKIVAIQVKQTVVNSSGSGIVVSWNAAAGTLQVTDAATSATETLTVSPQATFKQGSVFVTGDQLKAGDSIAYEVKAGVVVSIDIAKPAVTTVSGKLFAVDKSKLTIQYMENDDLKIKFYNANASIKIDGLLDAGFDDLQKDDAVTLTLDDKGNVSNIAVTGRSITTLIGATVGGYVANTKTLSLTDANGEVYNLILNANVRYDVNGTSIDAALAVPQLVTGKKITIAYSGKNAVKVSLGVKYAGTVTENNTVSKTLKIKTDAGTTVAVPYAFPVMEQYGAQSTSAVDLKPGDAVSVLLSGTSDLASTILVQKAAQFEVVSVDVGSSKIRLKPFGSAATEEYTLASTVVLQYETGAGASLVSYTPGSIVNVTFMGKTPIKIKSVSVTAGIVVSVNAAASTIELALPNGEKVTKSIGASPSVQRDNGTQLSLSGVQVNDRVEIRQDENDRTAIMVITGQTRKVSRYDSGSKSVLVQVSNLKDQSSFPIDASVYIHQGTTTLRAEDLKYNDVITLYFLRGKLVEISKA